MLALCLVLPAAFYKFHSCVLQHYESSALQSGLLVSVSAPYTLCVSCFSVSLTGVAPVPKRVPARPANPCLPSPCGPLSQCRRSGSTAVCSCQPGYVSAPPTCRPECVVSSQCALNRACVNQKCVDPCPGVCGLNARCQVVNHAPVCSCNPGYTGDPFSRCLRPDSKLLT